MSDQVATSSISNRARGVHSVGILPDLILVIFGVIFGFAVTNLLIVTRWQVLLAALVTVPVILVVFRYPFFGLALWLILGPFLMTTQTVEERRVYWVIHRALPPLVLMLIAWKGRKVIHRVIPFTLGIPELAMAGYVLVSLLSIALQHRAPLATTYLFYDRVFSPMCIYMLIRLWRPTEEDLRRLMPVVFFLAASQSLIGIVSWIAPQYLPTAWLEKQGARTIGSLVNPSVYTVALVFSGGILVHAAFARKPGIFRFLFVGTAVLAFGCVFLSLSRASWLVGLLVLAGLAYLYRRQVVRFAVLILLFMLIVGALFLPDMLTLASQRLSSDESGRSALSRLPVYLAGLRMFAAKPVAGWGYGNFDRYDRGFQSRLGGVADDNKDHASHNLYLTLVAEQGLLGSVLFLAPVIWWLAMSWKKRCDLPSEGLWSRKLLGVLWLSILAHIVVNNFMNMRVPFGLGLWWVTLGLIATVVDSPSTYDESRAVRVSTHGELSEEQGAGR